MKDSNKVLIFVTVIIIAWLILSRSMDKKEIRELEKQIRLNDDLNHQIKAELSRLISSNHIDDTNIKEELESVLALIQIKKESKAMFSLTKIIENLFKRLYSDNTDFKKEYKEATLHNCIEFAKANKDITKAEYHLLMSIKSSRNEEAHEINVKADFHVFASSLITGITIILHLYNKLREINLK